MSQENFILVVQIESAGSGSVSYDGEIFVAICIRILSNIHDSRIIELKAGNVGDYKILCPSDMQFLIFEMGSRITTGNDLLPFGRVDLDSFVGCLESRLVDL